MPLNLDSCITGIFVPGNIGASSGLPPVVRVMPPRVPTVATVAIIEIASATDLTDQRSAGAAVTEAATATDTQNATVGLPLVARDAMVAGVFVNSDGTLREANVDGVMVNL